MKSKIYTKTGDSGQTSLVSGTRISKSDPRVDIYGGVDELNSWLGVVIALMKEDHRISGLMLMLQKLQSNLFRVGSLLACESENREKLKLKMFDTNLINELESSIDEMSGNLPKIKNFILPGGSLVSSYLHVIRTVVRRIERQMVEYNGQNPDELPDDVLILMNRLSDYIFVLARDVNHKTQGAEISVL